VAVGFVAVDEGPRAEVAKDRVDDQVGRRSRAGSSPNIEIISAEASLRASWGS
jgi:hypothetical protein